MWVIQSIKKLSRKGKLKLQRKLENDSLGRTKRVKKIILIATMAVAIGSLCYAYRPSRRFILTIGSKVFKSKQIHTNTEIVKPKEPSTRNQITIILLSTLILTFVKFSLVKSEVIEEVPLSASQVAINEDNPAGLFAGMGVFTILLKLVTEFYKII